MIKLRIGVDGGDYYPGAPLNSGIKRIVDNVLRIFTERYDKKVVVHRYFYRHWGKLFGSLRLPFSFLLNRNNVFLGFSGQIPALLRICPAKKILFLYDLGFYPHPDHFIDSERLRTQTERSLALADEIVVSSRITEQELLGRFPYLVKEKINPIYPGIDHLSMIKPFPFPTLPKKYFLSVGVIKPSKNTTELIEIFCRFCAQCSDKTIKLILAGKSEPTYQNTIVQSINRSALKDRVLFLDVVPDNQLVTLYKNCIAFINTALVEGFAFPVLEALTFGKPVIVTALPLYQEYQRFFPNLTSVASTAEMIKTMHATLNTTDQQKQLLNQTLIPPQFTWDNFVYRLFQLVN